MSVILIDTSLKERLMAEYKRILHVEDDKTFQLEVDVVLKDITEIVHVDNIKDAKEKFRQRIF